MNGDTGTGHATVDRSLWHQAEDSNRQPNIYIHEVLWLMMMEPDMQ